MSRLKREGNPPSGQLASPVPQAWDPSINDFREITGQNLGGGRFGADGVQWGKTASGLFMPVRVTNDGVQEVQVSGTNVLLAQGETVVAAGATVSVTTDVSVADVREVYAYAGKAQTNAPWKLEIRFKAPWSAGSGWDNNVSYQNYVAESTFKNAYIEPVKCVSSTVRLIIQNNHTQDMTFRWCLGGLR